MLFALHPSLGTYSNTTTGRIELRAFSRATVSDIATATNDITTDTIEIQSLGSMGDSSIGSDLIYLPRKMISEFSTSMTRLGFVHLQNRNEAHCAPVGTARPVR
jgi:carbohydrate-binding DOMON domain-containing protein